MAARLHSLTGLVPASVFVILHLGTNAQALRGQLAFDAAVGGTGQWPFLVVFEALGLWIPLCFHGIYGLHRAAHARPNLASYPLSRHWAYLGQRLTGVVLFIFLLSHFGQYRLRVLLGLMNHSDYFEDLCAGLGGTGAFGVPWLAIGYLLAIAAVTFHLSNGLHGFCCSWGITRSLAASRRLSALWGAIGVVLFVVGASTVVYFSTGWRLGQSEGFDAPSPPAVSCGDLADVERAAIARTGVGTRPALTPAPAGSRK